MTKVVSADSEFAADGPTAVTVGKFDGVHVGHQAVVDRTLRAAADIGGKSIVVCLWPHPASVLRPGTAVPQLTNLDDRLDLLAYRGPDFVRVVTFDLAFAAQTADEFLMSLRRNLGMEVLTLGADARFGRDRHAGIDELKAITNRIGVRLDVVSFVGEDDPVRSGLVKKAYSEGDIEAASRMLLRLPSYAGRVERGEGRGRDLGFPTANLRVADGVAIPARGVYKGSAIIEDDQSRGRIRGVLNLGTRPTFEDNGDLLLEAHLFDFNSELYGKRLRVYFEKALRPERKFDGVDDLLDALRSDVDAATALPDPDASLYAPWHPAGLI